MADEMLDELSSLPLVVAGFLGSLLAGLGTAVGALPIFLRARWSQVAQALMLALAAGVMLGATVFSLLLPALEVVVARTGMLFVISGEIIPETHRAGIEQRARLSLVFGFVLR